jgi:hypothetical protein
LNRSVAEDLAGGIEHMETCAAANRAMGSAQLRAADAKAGSAMGALGDECLGHGTIR